MSKQSGDRKDGALIRNLDSMHYIMPIIYPNRCDNEAFISERIDLSNVDAFLARKNAENPEYQYNLFQIVVTAMLKTITLRPKMNRFIANKTMYQRNELSAAFVVKREFADNGGEALAPGAATSWTPYITRFTARYFSAGATTARTAPPTPWTFSTACPAFCPAFW